MADAKTPRVQLRPPPEQPESLHEIGGSRYNEVNTQLISQAIHAQWHQPSAGAAELDEMRAATAYMMAQIRPRDEIEGMLVAQMVAAHGGAMECYRRAMIADQSFDSRNVNLKFGDRLSRTYAELMTALQKYRGKGQQHVTVKHVHVHDGGQAIVGTVQAGGGAARGIEGQPHAWETISDGRSAHMFAGGTAMPCADSEGQAVPVSRDAERPLPHARRHQHGRA